MSGLYLRPEIVLLRSHVGFIQRLVIAVMMLEVEDKAAGDLDIIYRLKWNRDTSVSEHGQQVTDVSEH